MVARKEAHRTGSILLGRGVLSWPREERISDRYGSVALFTTAGDDAVSLPFEKASGYGRLVAEILETRDSTHVGDWFRGFYPTRPEVGETIVLGVGRIFFDTVRDGATRMHVVGLKPSDGREKDWLDPKALYRAHHQTVALRFEPIESAEKTR